MLPNSPIRSAQSHEAHASGLVLDLLTAGEIRSVLLYEGEWTIGSESSNRIVIETADIQDRHCRVLIDDAEIVVQAWAADTFVNGLRVEEAPLAIGDTLILGSTAFLVREARPDELLAQLPKVSPVACKAAAQTLRNKTLLARISSTANLLDLLEFEFGQVEVPPTDSLDRTIDRIERGTASAQATAKAQAARCKESFFSIRNQTGELTELLQVQFEGIDQEWQSRVQVDVDAIIAQAWAAEASLSGSEHSEDVLCSSREDTLELSGSGLLVRSVRAAEVLAQIPCVSSSPLSGTAPSSGYEALLNCIGSIANSLDRLESNFPVDAPLDRVIARIQRGLSPAEAASPTMGARCAETFIAIRHELEELTEVLQSEFEGDESSSLPNDSSLDLEATRFERERAKRDAAFHSSKYGTPQDSQTGAAAGDLKLDIDRLFELSKSLSKREASIESGASTVLDGVQRGFAAGDLSQGGDESRIVGLPVKNGADDSPSAVVAEGLSSGDVEELRLLAERQKLARYAKMIEESSAERSASESCQDEDVVAIGSGAILIRINETQNVLRSRNEAVRQLDELLLSHAEGDADISDAFSKTWEASGRRPMPPNEATFEFDSGDSLCPDSPDGSLDGSQEGSNAALAKQLSADDGAAAQCDSEGDLSGDGVASELELLPSNVADSPGPLLVVQELETLIAEHVASDVSDVDSIGSEGTSSSDTLAPELLGHSEVVSEAEVWSNDSSNRVRLLEAAIAQEVDSDIEDSSEQLADDEAEQESTPSLRGYQEAETIDPAGDDEQSRLLRAQLADMFGISRSLERLSQTTDEAGLEEGVDEGVEDAVEGGLEASAEYFEDDAANPSEWEVADVENISPDDVEVADVADVDGEYAANDAVEEAHDTEVDAPESAIDDVMSGDLFTSDDSAVKYFEPGESHVDDDLDSEFTLFGANEPENSEHSDEPATHSANIEAMHAETLPAADEAEVSDEVGRFEESESEDVLPRLFSKAASESLESSSDAPPPNDDRKTLNLRSQLADLFGMNPSAAVSSSAETQKSDEKSPAGVDQPTEATAPPEPKPVEPVDPIRAYMEQLLARNRKQAPPENVRPPVPDAVTVSQQQPEAVETSKSRVTSTEWLNQGPTHKQDKDAVRANMQQLRALANQQARAAVVQAGKKQLRLQIMTKAGAAFMSLIFGSAALLLKVPPLYGFACIGMGVLFTIDLIISVFRNARVLSKQERLIQDWVDEEAHLKANPRTEDRLEQFTRAAHNEKRKP